MRITSFVIVLFSVLLSAELIAQEGAGFHLDRRECDPCKTGAGPSTEEKSTAPPGMTGSEIDKALSASPTFDVNAFTRYREAVLQLLQREDFARLETIAEKARSEKERFPGGVWTLYVFYGSLETPPDSEKDWSNHLGKLERWKTANPTSVTARIALAGAYLSYGHEARGTGSAEEVTEDGWKLLAERVEIARKLLLERSAMRVPCPHWYLLMQRVVQYGDSTKEQQAALFRKAIALEPHYYYLYRTQATLLLPKWNGDEGEVERFANDVADELGGQDGDIVYFEIASEMLRQRAYTQLKNMSWERVQRGYAAMRDRYGVSLNKLNQLAAMAGAVGDPATAEKSFEQIGDRWDQDVWGSKKSFDTVKEWAPGAKLQLDWWKGIYSAIDENMKTPEGQQYHTRITEAFSAEVAPALRECGAVPQGKTEVELLVKFLNDGLPQNLIGISGREESKCVFLRMRAKPFLAPPKPEYWLRILVNVAPAPAPASDAPGTDGPD